MRDLEDLIRFERESTGVDFKAVQYPTEKHDDLLSDVIGMANADVEGDRFLVLGVKVHRDGSRLIRGVDEVDLRDPADYQQLVSANVEPEIEIDYVPIEIDGRMVVVVRISSCGDPPYLMRKNFRRLTQGYGVIRRGTTTLPLTRKDYDRFAKRSADQRVDLSGKISLSFVDGESVNQLAVEPVGDFTLPSEEAAARIKAILDERSRVKALDSNFGWRIMQNLPANLMGGSTPYDQRPTETLQKNLKHVKETYAEHDLHHVFEVLAHRLQLYIFNSGERYLEDASIRLRFPKVDGLVIADQIYRKPRAVDPFGLGHPPLDLVSMHYPQVEETESAILVQQDVGDVRHGVWAPAFTEELRIFLGPPMQDTEIAVGFAVGGRNLPRPVEGVMQIAVKRRPVDEAERSRAV